MTEETKRKLRELLKYHIIIPDEDEQRPKIPEVAELKAMEDAQARLLATASAMRAVPARGVRDQCR